MFKYFYGPKVTDLEFNLTLQPFYLRFGDYRYLIDRDFHKYPLFNYQLFTRYFHMLVLLYYIFANTASSKQSVWN